AFVPPGGRVEFIIAAPPLGIGAGLVTRVVDTGPQGENDPTRPLVTITSTADAVLPQPLPVASGRQAHEVLVASITAPKLPAKSQWLGEAEPVRTRHLFFFEEPQDPKNPNSPTKFYLTIEGQPN